MSLFCIELSQMAVVEEDVTVNSALFPKGELDVNGQQIDLRDRNSWTLLLEDVSNDRDGDVWNACIHWMVCVFSRSNLLSLSRFLL